MNIGSNNMVSTENTKKSTTEPGLKTTDQILIKAEKLIKTYDTGEIQVEALRNLDLEILRGEMIAIMGPSGCGKTTLLNCLSGIDDINSGNILIEGQDLAKMSDKQRTEYRAKKMGFIFQSYNLLPVFTAVENVELPLLITGMNPKSAREKGMKVLEIVGLSDWVLHKPSQLSGGQQQRVAIARSLVNDPLIVWADEPTGNLDKTNTVQIMELINKLNKEHDQTYVLVTHDQQVASLADRIVQMEMGKIVEAPSNG
jgi:putative ABC transport system ATP-binding protein